MRNTGYDADVLILGAGISGIKAAARLHEAGRSFLVLEQSGRIGGRMWDEDWGGAHIELGANWIEGIPQNENPIWKIGVDIGLHGNYTSQEGSRVEPTLYDKNGRLSRAKAKEHHTQLSRVLQAAFNVSCARHLANQPDISLRAALTQVGWPEIAQQTPIQRTLEFFVIDWDFEYPAEQISLFNYYAVGHADSWREVCDGSRSSDKHHTLRFTRARMAARSGLLGDFSWESPRYFVSDRRGYSAVARQVGQAFLPVAAAASGSSQVQPATNSPEAAVVSRASGDAPSAARNRVLLNKNVTHIFHGEAEGGVRVRTADGSEFMARYAISTFSAGVVNTAIASRSLFYPELPQWKREALAKVLHSAIHPNHGAAQSSSRP